MILTFCYDTFYLKNIIETYDISSKLSRNRLNIDGSRPCLVLRQFMFGQKRITIGLITVTLIDLLFSAILKVQSFVLNLPHVTGCIAFQFCLFELALVEIDHFNTKCRNYVSMFRIQIRSNQYYQYYIVKHFAL